MPLSIQFAKTMITHKNNHKASVVYSTAHVKGTRKKTAKRAVSGKHWRIIWGSYNPRHASVGADLRLKVKPGKRLLRVGEEL